MESQQSPAASETSFIGTALFGVPFRSPPSPAMQEELLESRRKALEGYFFEKDQELWDALKHGVTVERAKQDLREVSGIHDESVLDELVRLKLSPPTLAAFAMTPLVFMAWASGSVSSKEAKVVLKAADERGVPEGSGSYRALEAWLQQAPADQLLDAWKHYTQSLMKEMTEDARLSVKREVLGRSKEIARAAGGLLGLGAICPDEAELLRELEAVFA